MLMRKLFAFLLFPALALAQDQAKQQIARFKACPTVECQLSQSIRIAEYYVETDHMDKAQEWLNYAKKINQFEPKDSIAFFINSLQSETFYYMELYQFGAHEAEKGIEKTKMLKDSLFESDAYFFKGINEIEMGEIDEAQRSLWRAKRFQPKQINKKHLRTLIVPAYIFNNLAQLKLRNKELDSALFYNRKSYRLAKQHQVFRGIVNGEQTFGLIYSAQKRQDSAVFYLQKSLASAQGFGLEDVAALDCGYLMQMYDGQPDKVRQYYQKGLDLVAHNEVNNSYQRLFYDIALDVFRKLQDKEQVLLLQDKIISVNRMTNHRANFYIQNITERYMASENKLLVSRINELNQERNIRILQLVAALFGFLVLLFVAIFFRRKNKLQQSLLEQKTEISKDLHDDIGSELSSILINANLLMKNYDTNEKQQFLLSKISHTSTEISQRLNAFIWSLNTENNSVANFCEYVKRYAAHLLEGLDITLHFSENIAAAEHKILNGYLRKNLFFCIKEALNNAVKHASASEIQLSVAADEKMLVIVVRDNGVGVASSIHSGNGFKNMQKRTEALKGSIQFEHRDGLEITFKVPIRP